MARSRRKPQSAPLEVFGECEAWLVETIWDTCMRLGRRGLFAEAAEAAKEAPRRCGAFGRMVEEVDRFGRQRTRILCWFHGLDVAAPEDIVPMFPATELRR